MGFLSKSDPEKNILSYKSDNGTITYTLLNTFRCQSRTSFLSYSHPGRKKLHKNSWMKQLPKLITPKKKWVNDDEEMEDDIEEKEYIDESEEALSNSRHEWARKMVPKINLEKARMRLETNRKRTVGSNHCEKEATKRQKKRQRRRENCLKEVDYTPTPVTPIFTIDSDDENDEGGENGEL